MFALGYPLKEIEITLCGAEIRGLADNIGFFGEIVILAAGGAVNLVCAAIVSSMPYRPEGAELFAACSAALALINFLPIRSLDGGRIAELALARALPARGATVINFISSAALATVWLVSVYLLLVLDGNISLLLFCLYLFVQLYLK